MNEWIVRDGKCNNIEQTDLNIEVKCAEERQQLKFRNKNKQTNRAEPNKENKTPRRVMRKNREWKLMGVIWCCERALQMPNQVQKMCANLMGYLFLNLNWFGRNFLKKIRTHNKARLGKTACAYICKKNNNNNRKARTRQRIRSNRIRICMRIGWGAAHACNQKPIHKQIQRLEFEREQQTIQQK